MGRTRKDGGQDLRFKGASNYSELPPFVWTLLIPIIFGFLFILYDLSKYNLIIKNTNFLNDITLIWWASLFIPIYLIFFLKEQELEKFLNLPNITLKKFLIYCYGFIFLMELISFFFPNLV
tara:strand:+ start:208 stop:570 length:363 start_codon:yes stop_codon:yes gene_type:complete